MSAWQRTQFMKYGDVVTFDTTFKTNSFRFPLGVLVGVDCFGKTTCFALCLVHTETIESFKWVFQRLKEAVPGYLPKIIYTDEDAAMASAISDEFPSSKHRLCSWHLERNLKRKVGQIPNYELLRNSFWLLVKNDYGEAFFNTHIQLMKDACVNNAAALNAIEHLLQIKDKWASCFSSKLFTMGQSATSRAEGINSIIKKELNGRIETIDDLVQVLDDRITNEMERSYATNAAQHKVKGVKLRYTLYSYSLNYPSWLSQFIIDKIEEQQLIATELINKVTITKAADQFLVRTVSDRTYTVKLVDFASPDTLTKIPNECSCPYIHTWALPCRHIFLVAMMVNARKIGDSLFGKRWSVQNDINPRNFTSYLSQVVDDSAVDNQLIYDPVSHKRRAFNNLVAFAKTVADVAVDVGKDQAMMDCLQFFRRTVLQCQVPSAVNSAHSSSTTLVQDPPVLGKKVGRPKSSTTAPNKVRRIEKILPLDQAHFN